MVVAIVDAYYSVVIGVTYLFQWGWNVISNLPADLLAIGMLAILAFTNGVIFAIQFYFLHDENCQMSSSQYSIFYHQM